MISVTEAIQTQIFQKEVEGDLFIAKMRDKPLLHESRLQNALVHMQSLYKIVLLF